MLINDAGGTFHKREPKVYEDWKEEDELTNKEKSEERPTKTRRDLYPHDVSSPCHRVPKKKKDR